MTTIETECPNCMAGIVLEPSVSGDDYHPDLGGTTVGFKKGATECDNCGERVYPILTVYAGREPNEVRVPEWAERAVKPVDRITIEYADGVTSRLDGEEATAWLGYVSEATDVFEEEHGEYPPDFEWVEER